MQCDPSDDCDTLWQNLARRQLCIDARQRVADRCFRGGDPSHRDEIDNYKRGADKCRKYIQGKRCPPPRCM